jgi:hypothetical protein
MKKIGDATVIEPLMLTSRELACITDNQMQARVSSTKL